jgi:kynureninase
MDQPPPDVAALDESDPLAAQRAKFSLPDGIVYLDGNSLGALPVAAMERVARVVRREWGEGLIRSWNAHDWIGLPGRVGAKIAGLIGAGPGEVVAADSTSVNLFKLIAAAMALRPGRSEIVGELGNFPTDLYMIEGASWFSAGRHRLRGCAAADLVAAIDDQTALVVLSQVHYKTGAVWDMASVTLAAHAAGALVLWDLSHSAGALAVDLNASDADLAVGCGYKFLNGGPGAPAFLYVASRHQEQARTPLSGWMGHARPFDFTDSYEAGEGVRRFLCGTPGIIGMSALDAALDVMLAVDIAAIQHKGRALGDLFIALVEQRCAGFGLELACPRDASRRGSQVSFRHPHGYEIMQALVDAGVIGDFRAPDILRFGFAPLYIRYEDVWRAVATLRDILVTGAWRAPDYAVRRAVT